MKDKNIQTSNKTRCTWCSYSETYRRQVEVVCGIDQELKSLLNAREGEIRVLTVSELMMLAWWLTFVYLKRLIRLKGLFAWSVSLSY